MVLYKYQPTQDSSPYAKSRRNEEFRDDKAAVEHSKRAAGTPCLCESPSQNPSVPASTAYLLTPACRLFGKLDGLAHVDGSVGGCGGWGAGGTGGAGGAGGGA